MTSPGAATALTPAGPQAWYAEVVRPLSDEYAPYVAESPGWVGVAELLGDGDRSLAALHRRLVDGESLPPDTAATYLAGWFAGYTAEVVGLGLAVARAGFLVEDDGLRWHLHPDGWPERIELGTGRAVVIADHPWAEHGDVDVVEHVDDVLRLSVERLVAVVTPIVDGCRRLARVGRVGLWNEVGDGLVMVLRHQNERLEVTEEMLAVVHAAARRPGVPWRSHAALRLVDTAWGPACVGRKGGCCLAYQRPPDPPGDDEADPDLAEFRRRFPSDGSRPQYCGTCSLRDRDDAEARQLFWFERAQRNTATPGADPPMGA